MGGRTLVAYSPGNFVAHHDDPILANQLEGMLSCDFVRQPDGGVQIENIVWTPLVNHDQEGPAPCTSRRIAPRSWHPGIVGWAASRTR